MTHSRRRVADHDDCREEGPDRCLEAGEQLRLLRERQNVVDTGFLAAGLWELLLGNNGEGAKTVTVFYHYQIANVAGWANSPEMKTAYPWYRVSIEF
jgi:hypothetical protein